MSEDTETVFYYVETENDEDFVVRRSHRHYCASGAGVAVPTPEFRPYVYGAHLKQAIKMGLPLDKEVVSRIVAKINEAKKKNRR